MKIGSLDRTAVFCWCPTSYPPLLALGTAAGAMDASFSAKTELEIFELDNSFKKRGTLAASARYIFKSNLLDLIHWRGQPLECWLGEKKMESWTYMIQPPLWKNRRTKLLLDIQYFQDL